MNHTEPTRNELIRLLTAILAHSLAVLAFILADRYAIPIYRSLYGPISRGIPLGLLVRILFTLFVIFNWVIALIPNLKVKLGLVVVLTAITGFFLFPDYPIRGYFYCAQASLLPLASIFIARWLHRVFSTRKVVNEH